MNDEGDFDMSKEELGERKSSLVERIHSINQQLDEKSAVLSQLQYGVWLLGNTLPCSK
jgi:hypothetical protein